jgi:hypothetical protein
VNVAVTDFAASIVMVHVVAVPVHAPPHPSNVESELVITVSVTKVPEL